MDKQAFSIILHSDYSQTFVALFLQNHCIDFRTIINKQTSKILFIVLEELLQTNNLKLSDLIYIGVHQGPGPFTTLRTILTSANGLSFATHIPLVGVDGLMTFATEQANSGSDYTIALLNAYSNDLYFAIHNNNDNSTETGCEKIETLLEKIKNLPSKNITFVGNGYILHQKKLEALTGQVLDTASIPSTVSLKAIGTQAWQQWQIKENVHQQLLPLYLKRALSMSAPSPNRP